ncbi:MAG: helix-turn-helix domain-containing protein [Bacteroidetes bacterium]|nr:helix-turn-helix domain-containing protein [Bacteroidota bacterium]
MNKFKELILLFQRDVSIKETARVLCISRNTVRRYRQQLEKHPQMLKELLAMEEPEIYAWFALPPAEMIDAKRYAEFESRAASMLVELKSEEVTNIPLRSFVGVMMSDLSDGSFLATLRASALVGVNHADVFDAAHATTLHRMRADADEERRARRDFVPHLWIEHERWYTQPVIVVGWFGVEPYKKLDVPANLLDADHPADVLLAVAASFWRAMFFHFRTTYDEYYVFSFAEQCFVERREGRPVVGESTHAKC